MQQGTQTAQLTIQMTVSASRPTGTIYFNFVYCSYEWTVAAFAQWLIHFLMCGRSQVSYITTRALFQAHRDLCHSYHCKLCQCFMTICTTEIRARLTIKINGVLGSWDQDKESDIKHQVGHEVVEVVRFFLSLLLLDLKMKLTG